MKVAAAPLFDAQPVYLRDQVAFVEALMSGAPSEVDPVAATVFIGL